MGTLGSTAFAKGKADSNSGESGSGNAVSRLASLEEAMKNFREAREEFFKSREIAARGERNEDVGGRETKRLESRSGAMPPSSRAPETTSGPSREIMLRLEKEEQRLLQRAAEVLIEREKKIIERVQKSEASFQSQKPMMLPKVTTHISKLENIKKEIAAAEDPEEIKILKQQIKTQKENQEAVEIRKSIILQYIESFENQAIKTAETRASRIESVLNGLQNSGKNISTLKTLLTAAKSNIELAKTILTSVKNNPLNPTVKSELEKALTQIKIAYKIFEDIAIWGKSL